MTRTTTILLPAIPSNITSAASLNLVPLTNSQQQRMLRLCRILRHAALGYSGRLPQVKLHTPRYVLAVPLNASQRRTIDELATAKVANMCVAAQAKIAKVPICESREGMVDLRIFAQTAQVVMTFSDRPYPDVSGPKFVGKPQVFWVRRGFAERLIVMAKLVAKLGLAIHVEEAFRPYEVQAGMFQRRVRRTKHDHPSWSSEKVMNEARSKTASVPRLASHMAGAAADVFLRDIRTGTLLDFGHAYPDGGAVVHPLSPFVTAKQWQCRQILEVAAMLAGLALYVGEDWHVSFGDNLFAWNTGVDEAMYGPVGDFDTSSGRIKQALTDDQLDCPFSL